MKLRLTSAALSVLALGAGIQVTAGVQSPHTLKIGTSYDKVTMSWQAPTAAKELKWHDGAQYNGDVAPEVDPQKPVITYMAARFTPEDLVDNIGDVVESISYAQYREVVSETVMVYKDNVEVSRGQSDMSAFVKGQMGTAALETPVTIEAGHEYMFVVRFEAGSNMDYVAIKDRALDAPGRGDLFSTDGKNWVAVGGGDYLVTANLRNDATEEAASYNILVDGVAKASVDAATLSHTLEGMTGTHTYAVEAVGADGTTAATQARKLTTNAYDAYLASPNISSLTNSAFDVSLVWHAPLKGGSSLTWGTDKIGAKIGGTATSNTKVWVRNQFSASDLNAFGSNAKIKSVKIYFAQAVVSQAIVWVQKDGVFDYYEEVSKDALSALTDEAWAEFALTTPYALEPGHAYSYGLYLMHTPKTNPIGVDNTPAVNVKGNSFSISSPNSTTFTKSNPSWKTLLSGGIEGNWMMTAELEGAEEFKGEYTYDVKCNGESVATSLAGTTYEGQVAAPGSYTYQVVARSGEQESLGASSTVNVALPAEYSAPMITVGDFDPETKTVSLAWSMDKSLSHCGAPTYIVGFDEDMPLMWGTEFTADELQPFVGGKIVSIQAAIGDEVKDLNIGVYGTKGEQLSVEQIGDNLEPLSLYNITLEKPYEIDGTQNIILAYSANTTGGTTPILIDGGPLVTNGARVSLTNGISWMNLGTLNSTYGKYNVFIMAVVSTDDGQQKVIRKQLNGKLNAAELLSSERLGVTALEVDAPAPLKAKAQSYNPVSFNVYCNGEIVDNTTQKEYTAKVTRFGKMTYNVTAVYNHGWESEASETVTVNNPVAQKAVAPYGLNGSLDGDNLVLSWQSPAAATRLSYNTGEVPTYYLGLNKTGNVDAYAAARFSAEDLTDHVGKYIEHITFALSDLNLNSAAVIVMKGENIIYTQSVPVSSLVIGQNDVRLNEPVEIVGGSDIGVGTFLNYPNNTKPMGADAGPAVANKGDLVSSSASAGYWYSLANKYKLDYNWWLTAILKEGDKTAEDATTQDADDVKYNVYCDGQLLAGDLSSTSYTVTAGADGSLPGSAYHVTAVTAKGESGESNKFYAKASGVTTIGADEVSGDNGARYFNLLGVEMNRANITPGLYIRHTAGGTTKVLVK